MHYKALPAFKLQAGADGIDGTPGIGHRGGGIVVHHGSFGTPLGWSYFVRVQDLPGRLLTARWQGLTNPLKSCDNFYNFKAKIVLQCFAHLT
jgi:hypothetical protein